MPSFDDIAAFVCEQAGANRACVTEATSLQDDIGIYGIDIDDLMAEYSKRFGVDLSGYLWYFHTGEEGFNIGGLFFRPPDAKVRRIPITVGMLYDSAQNGRWNVTYPEHKAPGFRPDILINQLLVVGMIGIAFVVVVRGCVS